MSAERGRPDEPRHPAFAHASEAELARILDFYDVRWEYEPHVFPILWSIDGDVLESFTPDFFLPDLDIYVELTTLKQRLVRKKNRKLRRLRELYPYIRIKLLYARDFRMLMLKYGKLALADALSGTVGQVVPAGRAPVTTDRAGPADPADPADPAPAGKPGSEPPGGRPARRRRRERPTAGAGATRSPAAGVADETTASSE